MAEANIISGAVDRRSSASLGSRFGTESTITLLRARDRVRMARSWWRLRLRDPALAHGFVRLAIESRLARLAHRPRPHRTRVAGLDLAFADYGDLRFLLGEVFADRCYDTELPPRPTIVDCGANIGLASLWFTRRWPGATVIAIEPLRSTFALLTENVAANGLQIELHRAALDDRDAEADMLYAPGALSHSSLRGGREWLTDRERVPTRTLSGILDGRTVDLLKLDVEGAELNVLEDIFQNGLTPGQIMVESHPELGVPQRAVAALLTAAGYSYVERGGIIIAERIEPTPL